MRREWEPGNLKAKLRPYFTYEYDGQLVDVNTAEDLAVWQLRQKENLA